MSLCRIRPVAPCGRVTGSRIRGLCEIPAAPAGTSLEPQPWFESLRSNKVDIRPAPCIASGNANLRTRLPDAARSFLFTPTLEDAMASLMVEPENFRPHDRSSLPASTTAPRCVSPTVRRATIPVHGANPQRRSQAPRGRRPADPRPWALRPATQGMRDRRPADGAGPATEPCRRAAEVLSLRGILRSDRTAWGNPDAGFRGDSAMTARDGINRLSNPGTIPYGKTGWPRAVGHAFGDLSPTALTKG